MATNKGQLCGKWPVTVDGVEVCVADTGVLDVQEDFIRTWLGDGDLLVDDGATSLLDDLRPLLGRDFRHVESVCGYGLLFYAGTGM